LSSTPPRPRPPWDPAYPLPACARMLSGAGRPRPSAGKRTGLGAGRGLAGRPPCRGRVFAGRGPAWAPSSSPNRSCRWAARCARPSGGDGRLPGSKRARPRSLRRRAGAGAFGGGWHGCAPRCGWTTGCDGLPPAGLSCRASSGREMSDEHGPLPRALTRWGLQEAPGICDERRLRAGERGPDVYYGREDQGSLRAIPAGSLSGNPPVAGAFTGANYGHAQSPAIPPGFGPPNPVGLHAFWTKWCRLVTTSGLGSLRPTASPRNSLPSISSHLQLVTAWPRTGKALGAQPIMRTLDERPRRFRRPAPPRPPAHGQSGPLPPSRRAQSSRSPATHASVESDPALPASTAPPRHPAPLHSRMCRHRPLDGRE